MASAISQRVARLGALEGHVLEHVRDAVLGLGLAARAGLDPDAERGAFEVRHVVGQNGHAVAQGRRSHAHTILQHRPRRSSDPCRAAARPDEGFDRTLIVGQHVEALLPFVKISQP